MQSDVGIVGSRTGGGVWWGQVKILPVGSIDHQVGTGFALQSAAAAAGQRDHCTTLGQHFITTSHLKYSSPTQHTSQTSHLTPWSVNTGQRLLRVDELSDYLYIYSSTAYKILTKLNILFSESIPSTLYWQAKVSQFDLTWHHHHQFKEHRIYRAPSPVHWDHSLALNNIKQHPVFEIEYKTYRTSPYDKLIHFSSTWEGEGSLWTAKKSWQTSIKANTDKIHEDCAY